MYSVHLPVCPSACLSICLSVVYLSVRLCIWLSFCLSFSRSICPSVCLSICMLCLFLCLSVCVSVCLPVRLSVCLPTYLFVFYCLFFCEYNLTFSVNSCSCQAGKWTCGQDLSTFPQATEAKRTRTWTRIAALTWYFTGVSCSLWKECKLLSFLSFLFWHFSKVWKARLKNNRSYISSQTIKTE